jgi:hypothetical protein
MPNNYRNVAWVKPPCGIEHMVDKWLTGKAMKHLSKVRLHPRTFTGC